jgi:hypothetical protein
MYPRLRGDGGRRDETGDFQVQWVYLCPGLSYSWNTLLFWLCVRCLSQPCEHRISFEKGSLDTVRL